jgi:ABC-type multidrug transport system fused ATPase/permease subunit
VIAGCKITRIIIAHRPALVERADIVILDGGRATVVRQGPQAAPRPAPSLSPSRA